METFAIIAIMIAFAVVAVIIMVGFKLSKKVEETDISDDIKHGVTEASEKAAKDLLNRSNMALGGDNLNNLEGKTYTGCSPWGEVERANLNGNSYCKNSFGDEYIMSRSTRGPCLPGFGVAVCVVDPNGPSKYWNNPIHDSHSVWNDDALRNQWCENDVGRGSRFLGQERAGQFPGWSKGRCSIPR